MEQSRNIESKGNVKIINLSKRNLNESEIKLLKRGLKFTPTPDKSNNIELKGDMNEFCRKMRLIEYFDGTEDDDISIVKNKSDFIPPKDRNQSLENFIEKIKSFPTENPKSIRSNLDNHEKEALESLKNDKSIVIKEADKGGSVIIMDADFYKHTVEKSLNDKQYYEKLPNNPEKQDRIKYFKFLENFEHCLTDKEYEYLTKFECKQSNFYGLPKVHKSKDIKNACTNTTEDIVNISNVSDLKMRPIIAGPVCQTHRLSNMIDIILRPMTKHVKSYIRDTTDFLNSLPEQTDEETILVSFDVESLYSNIPHDLGLRAIKYFLNKYPFEIDDRFSDDFILQAIEFILKNNTFYFNNEYFRQRKGTAMGTKFAPIYATLVLGYIEEILYSEIAKEFGENFSEYFKHFWKRFLDDVFILWNRDRYDLNKLNEILNTLHPDLNFTNENNQHELAFLDVKIINNRGKLETDLYHKETDSRQYLPFSSCHPRHIKTNIPFCLARRICSIVSNDNKRQQRLDELKEILKEQQYPQSIINTGIEKAKNLTIQELRTVKTKTDENIIPFVSTFNPRNPEMHHIIIQNIPILYADPDMKEIFAKYDIIKSKRQPFNLKKILTRAKFEEITPSPGIRKCQRPNCGLCEHIIEGDTFNFNCGKTFKIKHISSCEIKNTIYVMKCTNCGLEYIGETGIELRKRVTVHRQQINDGNLRFLKVSHHLAACPTTNPRFKIFPFYKMNTTNINDRKNKEEYFIKLFKPALNSK